VRGRLTCILSVAFIFPVNMSKASSKDTVRDWDFFIMLGSKDSLFILPRCFSRKISNIV